MTKLWVVTLHTSSSLDSFIFSSEIKAVNWLYFWCKQWEWDNWVDEDPEYPEKMFTTVKGKMEYIKKYFRCADGENYSISECEIDPNPPGREDD